jgi:L-glyceraldehyde reductase
LEGLTNYADFIIPDEEFVALNKLDKKARYNYPFRWGVDIFGELGAAEAERRAEEHAAKQRAA